jgi:hypothetical protein
MPTWLIFVAMRLAIVAFLARGRMDPVRMLGAFAAFEVAYLFAWRWLVWYSHPAVSGGMIESLALVILIGVSVGLPAVAFLWFISRLKYFQGKHTSRMTFRRCLVLIPCFFILSLVQGL